MSEIKFNIVGDASGFKKAVADAKAGVSDAKRQIESEGQAMSDVFNKIGKTIGAVFTATMAKELVTNIARVRGEFQQLEVSFRTMLGSADKANALMAQITQTAAITPFGLQDVANGAKQLLAYGVASEKVNETLIRLGDISAGLSIPLNDLVYLYGTTMTQGRLFTQDFRQFQGRGIPIAEELAKQFGVVKAEVGALVTAGRVGFPEIEKAIVSMTSEGGKFAGLMEAQSKTITGQISNLEDSIDSMFNEIGRANEGIIGGALSGASVLVENYQAIGETLMFVATAYGINKAVMALHTATSNAMIAQEIASYNALLGVKTAENASEAETLALKKGISVAKAQELLETRALVQAKIQELATTQATALAKKQEALASLALANKELASIEARMVGNNALFLQNQRDLAVRKQRNAQKAVEIATTEAEIATTALNTATTQANTIANTANAKSVNLLVIAKAKLAKVSGILKDFISANPYLLLATAIAGVAFSIYKVATASNAFESAQEHMAKLSEQIAESTSKNKREAEDYVRTIKDENALTHERVSAYQKLMKLMPNITEQYSLQELQVMDNDKAQQLLNEEYEKFTRSQLEDTKKKYSDTENVMSEFWEGNTFWSFLKQIDGNKPFWANLGGSLTTLTGLFIGASKASKEWGKNIAENANKAIEELNALEEEQAFLALPVETQITEASANKEKAEKEAKELKAKAEKALVSGDNTLFVEYHVEYQFKVREKDKWEERLNKALQAPTYAEQKKQWKVELAEQRKLLKEQSKDSSRATETDREATRKNIKDLESKLGYKTTSKGKTPEELLADYEKTQQSLNKLQEEQMNQQAEQARDMYFKLQEIEVELMTDASKKRIAQNKLNREKERWENQKELKSAQDAEIANQKAIFDAQEDFNEAEAKKKGKQYTKKVFTDDNINWEQLRKIADQYERLDEIQERLYQHKTKAEEDQQRKQAMIEYYNEYGKFEEKMQAIELDYAQKIKDARIEGVKDEENFAIKSLKKQKEEAISALNFKQFQKNMDWNAMFGDLSVLSTERLSQLREQLDKFIQSDTTLNESDKSKLIEQYHKLGEAIEDNSFSLGKLFGWETEEQKKINRLKEEYEYRKKINDQAQEALNKAKDNYDTAVSNRTSFLEMLGLGSSAPREAVEVTLATGQATGRYSSEQAVGLLSQFDSLSQGVEVASNAFQSASTGAEVAGANMASAGASAMGAAGGFAGTIAIIDKIIHTIDKNVQSMVELTEMLNLEDTEFGAGVQNFAKSSEYAVKGWESLKSGDIVGVVVGVLGSLRWLGETFGIGDTDNQRRIEALQGSIDDLKKVNEDLAYEMERLYSSDKSQILGLQNKNLGQQITLLQEQIREEEGKKYETNQDAIEEYKDKIKEIERQIEENKRMAIEAMTGTDISSAIDSFATALADAWQNGTDSAYESVNVVKKLLRTGIVEYIKKVISPDVEALMGNMANYLGDGVISEYEQAQLEAEAKAIANKSDQLLGTAKKAGLLTDEASSGTSGGVSAMSQETAEELNGRFTAMQISVEAMRTSTQVMQGALGGLIAQITPAIAVTTESSRTLGEIRDLAIQRNDYLADIAKYTKGNLAEVTSMAKEIVKIKDKL